MKQLNFVDNFLDTSLGTQIVCKLDAFAFGAEMTSNSFNKVTSLINVVASALSAVALGLHLSCVPGKLSRDLSCYGVASVATYLKC